MKVTCGNVYAAAIALIDELGSTGETETQETQDYYYRAPAIVNSLVNEFWVWSRLKGVSRITSHSDVLTGVPEVYALGIMHYGLAADLLVDENYAAANFYEQRYEELRDRYFATEDSGADMGKIVDVYGGIEHGRYSRW